MIALPIGSRQPRPFDQCFRVSAFDSPEHRYVELLLSFRFNGIVDVVKG